MSADSKVQQVMQIHNVNLEEFERAVYSRDHDAASSLLLETLRKFKAGAEFIGYQIAPEMKTLLYTRYCAAVIALLADPEFKLSQEGFNLLASEHAIMDVVFRASTFGSSDHLLPQMTADPAEKDTTKIKFTDGAGLTKYMMTHSMRSGFKMNFEEAFKKDPNITLPLYVGMLTAMHVCNPTAQSRKELLLGMHELFSEASLPETALSPISDAYMYCSYGQRKDKHAFKGLVHRLYAKLMRDKGYVQEEFPTARKLVNRPTMLIPVEWFTSLHAMFRCYAPVIRQLRTKFKLIGAGRPHSVDEVSVKEFDQWMAIPEADIALSTIIERIRKMKPDVIYYPSLGMDLIWVALASVRLAPIQMMTLGHPASSQSPAMDYVLSEEGDVLDATLFTEKVVPMPRGSLFRFVMRPDADLPIPVVPELSPPVIKLAVPAMLLKLNATFLETLSEIRNRAGRPVEFHFWPNMVAVNLFQASREIRELLPGAYTYERSQYNEYMRQLQGCHIQLGTFPFGGTNSNIDCMLLGMPLVCMEGTEPHSTVDATMMRKIQMPEWLISHTTEEYITAAVRLIRNDEERQGLSRYLLEEADVNGTFFGECPDELKTVVVDTAWRIYENH